MWSNENVSTKFGNCLLASIKEMFEVNVIGKKWKHLLGSSLTAGLGVNKSPILRYPTLLPAQVEKINSQGW